MDFLKYTGTAAATLCGFVGGLGTYHSTTESTEAVIKPSYSVVYVNKTHKERLFESCKNTQAANPHTFPSKLNQLGFYSFVDNLKNLTGKDSLTLTEFVAYFCCVYNETGGRFKALSELGSDKYFFDAMQLHNGTWKMSYNTIRGNERAGDYLLKAGVLKSWQKNKVDLWNGTVYPEMESEPVKKAARNADFYKFRGQGLIQITNRMNFNRFVMPEIPNLHELQYANFEKLVNSDSIAYRVVRNYFEPYSKVIDRVNIGDWNAFGHLVSGRAVYHHFAQRCEILFRSLEANR